MFEGLFSPARLDGNFPSTQTGRTWEQGSLPDARSMPEVAYTLREQCDDDYFLATQARQKNTLVKSMHRFVGRWFQR